MLLNILLIVIFLSFLILIHEFGHFIAAKFFGLRVDEFGFGFPPRLFVKKIGETEYSFNLLPLGGFVKIYGESLTETAADDEKRKFSHQLAWKKFIIISSGVMMNFLVGWLVLSAVLMLGSRRTLIISGIQDDSPAALAGLQAGDQILEISLADESLKNPAQSQEFIDFVNRFRGQTFLLKINRSGEALIFPVGSRISPPMRQGSMGVEIFSTGIEPKPFLAALSEGLKAAFQAAGSILKAIYQLLTRAFVEPGVLQGVVGPVGIFSIASQASSLGFVYFLQLIGFISVNLAVLNFVPFPALDGGRLLFILIEKIKGSPLRPRTEQLANAAGLALLLFLMAAITVRDIVNLL